MASIKKVESHKYKTNQLIVHGFLVGGRAIEINPDITTYEKKTEN